MFFFGCSEVNSTWLITSELANQRARKLLFTCVVYTNKSNSHSDSDSDDNNNNNNDNNNDDDIFIQEVAVTRRWISVLSKIAKLRKNRNVKKKD